MSFYVSVYDNNDEVVFLSGWNWSDFGKALSRLGVEKKNNVYNVRLGDLEDLFVFMNKVKSDERYTKLVQAANISEGMYEYFLYDKLFGLEEYSIDVEMYDKITNPEVAAAIRKVDLEYHEKRVAEAEARRFDTYQWFNDCVSSIDNDSLAYETKNMMEEGRILSLVRFLSSLEDFMNDKGKDYVVELVLG